ncbi:hypothetical protein [Bacillus bombysepticus]|uniref:hypothetical protein n=1 Tax=Bacillus bombysepticus TaxID=658666 RepID=UPI0030187511
MKEQLEVLQELYVEYEKHRKQSKEDQLRAKEFKDEIMHVMEEAGIDDVVVDGLDIPVRLSIVIQERVILNKKELAQELDVSQRELSKPQTIISLTKDGKLSEDMIEKYTITEERPVFSAKEVTEDGE